MVRLEFPERPLEIFGIVSDVAADSQGGVMPFGARSRLPSLYRNARVHRFAAEGEFKASWEPGRDKTNEFHLVHGMRVGADGLLSVCDRGTLGFPIKDVGNDRKCRWVDLCPRPGPLDS